MTILPSTPKHKNQLYLHPQKKILNIFTKQQQSQQEEEEQQEVERRRAKEQEYKERQIENKVEMKSLVSHHNHNTSGHSLRKFRNMKYFQDQRGYETDYMKRNNEGLVMTPQQKKGKNKFDDQVNEYLRKVGSAYTGESMIADDNNKNLDYASEVESKIKTLEAKHLAGSVIFQKLSHCHSELMNLHNAKQSSTNQTIEKITNKSLEQSNRTISQRQFKSQINLTITSTPYKSPSFQNKKSTKSMQIQGKPVFFNQSNNYDTISKIMESSLDKLDEEDIAENIHLKEKILDSLNEPINNDEEFDNLHLDGMDEHGEDHRKQRQGINFQKQINNQSDIVNRVLNDSNQEEIDDLAMQHIDESDTLSISQKLILLGSNIKSKNPLRDDDSSYQYHQQMLRTPNRNLKSGSSAPNHIYQQKSIQNNNNNSQNQYILSNNNINNNNNNHQNFNKNLNNHQIPNMPTRLLSPDLSNKRPVANGNFFQTDNKDQKKEKFGNIVQHAQVQLTARSNGQRKAQNVTQNKSQQLSASKFSKERQEHENRQEQMASAPKQQQASPSKEEKNGVMQQNSTKKIEKYYMTQVERQNDVVQQQQKQIIQYQQQLQQQTLEFQLFMQEQQLLQQQSYFQQQQQLMQQQRLSASSNLFMQTPFQPTLPPSMYIQSPNAANPPLFSFQSNPLIGSQPYISPLMIPGQQPSPAGAASFIPQVPHPIIINNNIQKKDFNSDDKQGQQINHNNNNNNSQQHCGYLTGNKNVYSSLQSPFCNDNHERGNHETSTPNGTFQRTADQSQQATQCQTEQQFFKNNNNSSSFAAGGNGVKRLSSQRRKWEIGQKTCTQSELSADEDYLTSYNREVKQPKQFEPHPLSLIPTPHQQIQQQYIVKKPVKFEVFWEREEIEQENKENQRNNSNKRTAPIEESRQETTIQKQYKNAIDQAETTTVPTAYPRSLQDIFVSKKNDLQRKLDYEKNTQQQVISHRNQSPDLSKEDLIQIRRDLLKPKAQQIIQSINFDFYNNSNTASHC